MAVAMPLLGTLIVVGFSGSTLVAQVGYSAGSTVIGGVACGDEVGDGTPYEFFGDITKAILPDSMGTKAMSPGLDQLLDGNATTAPPTQIGFYVSTFPPSQVGYTLPPRRLQEAAPGPAPWPARIWFTFAAALAHMFAVIAFVFVCLIDIPTLCGEIFTFSISFCKKPAATNGDFSHENFSSFEAKHSGGAHTNVGFGTTLALTKLNIPTAYVPFMTKFTGWKVVTETAHNQWGILQKAISWGVTHAWCGNGECDSIMLAATISTFGMVTALVVGVQKKLAELKRVTQNLPVQCHVASEFVEVNALADKADEMVRETYAAVNWIPTTYYARDSGVVGVFMAVSNKTGDPYISILGILGYVDIHVVTAVMKKVTEALETLQDFAENVYTQVFQDAVEEYLHDARAFLDFAKKAAESIHAEVTDQVVEVLDQVFAELQKIEDEMPTLMNDPVEAVSERVKTGLRTALFGWLQNGRPVPHLRSQVGEPLPKTRAIESYPNGKSNGSYPNGKNNGLHNGNGKNNGFHNGSVPTSPREIMTSPQAFPPSSSWIAHPVRYLAPQVLVPHGDHYHTSYQPIQMQPRLYSR